MGARQRDWARRWTERLRAALGGKCARCGTTKDLEFDCIVAMGDQHHKMEWSWRLSFYRRQFEAGNLQLLCTEDNARKGARCARCCGRAFITTIAGSKPCPDCTYEHPSQYT